MRYYPSDDMQTRICEFYAGYGITLEKEKVFPPELKGFQPKTKYVMEKSIPPENLLPLSCIDQKLLPYVTNDAERSMERTDLQKSIDQLLGKLPTRQEEMVRRYFGIPGQPETMEGIGESYKMTGTMVGVYIRRAIMTLRRQKNSEVLKPYFDAAGELFDNEPYRQPVVVGKKR
jgi:hypothetical protein